MHTKRILSLLIALIVFAASVGVVSLEAISCNTSDKSTNIGLQSLLPVNDGDESGVRSCFDGAFQNKPSQCNTSFSGDLTVIDCCGQLQDMPREDRLAAQAFPISKGFLKSIFRRAP